MQLDRSTLISAIAATAILLPLAAVAHYFYRLHSIESTFWDAQKLAARNEIERQIGQPDSVGPCSDHLSWGTDHFNPPKNNGECVAWARYNFALEAFAFGYSTSGQLVSKYHFVSE